MRISQFGVRNNVFRMASKSLKDDDLRPTVEDLSIYESDKETNTGIAKFILNDHNPCRKLYQKVLTRYPMKKMMRYIPMIGYIII